MKRTLSWMRGMGSVAAALSFLVAAPRQQGVASAAEPAKGQAPKAAPAPVQGKAAVGSQPAGAPAAGGEKIAYTFDDDAKMRDFTNLWRQRQGIVLRMTVLQSYWNEEQAALAQLNNKFSTDYKLDVTKNYVLDDKRRVLIEREAPPVPEAAAQNTGPGADKSQKPDNK